MDVRDMERIWQQVACFLLCDTVTEAMETVLKDAGFSWDENLHLRDAPQELLRRQLAAGASNEESGEREGFDLYYVDEDGRMIMPGEQQIERQEVGSEDPVEGAVGPTNACTSPPIRCSSSSISKENLSHSQVSDPSAHPNRSTEAIRCTLDGSQRQERRSSPGQQENAFDVRPESSACGRDEAAPTKLDETEPSLAAAPLRNITNGMDHAIQESNTMPPIRTQIHRHVRLNCVEDLHRGIAKAMRQERNRLLWKRILLFQAADLRDIQEAVQSTGLKCPLNQLATYLDGEGVPYTRTRARRTRPARLSVRAKQDER